MKFTFEYSRQPILAVRYQAYIGERMIWTGTASLADIHMMPDAKRDKTVRIMRRGRSVTIKMWNVNSEPTDAPVTFTYGYGMRPPLWVVYVMSIHNGATAIWLGCTQTHRLISIPDARDDYEGVQQIIRDEPITITILSLHEMQQDAEKMRDVWLMAYHPYFIRSKYILDEKPRGRPSKGPVIELTSNIEFDSAGAAARYFRIDHGQVARSIKNKSATAKGLKFRYIPAGY